MTKLAAVPEAMMSRPAIQGFVLAGGKSRRMGRDKALMQMGGKELVVRAAEALRPWVHGVALIAPAGRYSHLGFPIIADQWPQQGPLAAVCTGLLASTAAWNVFLACDLPLLSQPFLRLLVNRVRGTRADAVAPRTADGWQPLAAAYHKRCGPAFFRAIEAGERSIIASFAALSVEAITPQDLAHADILETELANINTPEDWARLHELAEGKR